MLSAGLNDSAGTAEDVGKARFGADRFVRQDCPDGIPTYWVESGELRSVLRELKADHPMLYDLFGIDERLREHRGGQPDADFTVVYHLLSLSPFAQLRIKVAVIEPAEVPSVVDIWPNANWYERETWDMFGIRFSGSITATLMRNWAKGLRLSR